MAPPKIRYDIEAMDKSARGFASFSERMKHATGSGAHLTRITTAIDKITFGKIGGRFRALAGDIGEVSAGAASVVDALGGLTGGAVLAGGATLGVAAGLVLAAKAAYDFTDPLAKSAVQLRNQSRLIGISTGDIQRFGIVNRMAGGEASDMTQALADTSAALNDAKWGRRPEVVFLLNQLGIKSRDARGAMIELADTFDRMPWLTPQSKQAIASGLGMGSITNLLMQGGANMRQSLAQSNQIVSDEDLNKLAKMQQQSVELDVAWTKLKNNVGSNLIVPWLTPALNGVNNFVNNLMDPNHWKSLVRDSSGRLRMQGYYRDGGHFHARGGVSADAGGPAPDATYDSNARGWRNNNPLNLKSAQTGQFRQFGSVADGFRASASQLQRYQDAYGLNTLQGIIPRWNGYGPESGNYINRVSKETGFDPSQGLDLHNGALLSRLMAAMARVENGSNPYSADQIQSALRPQSVQVDINLKNAPEGTTSIVRTAGPNITAGLKTVGPMGLTSGH